MDQNTTVNCIQSVYNRVKPDFKNQKAINMNFFRWHLMSVVPPLAETHTKLH